MPTFHADRFSSVNKICRKTLGFRLNLLHSRSRDREQESEKNSVHKYSCVPFEMHILNSLLVRQSHLHIAQCKHHAVTFNCNCPTGRFFCHSEDSRTFQIKFVLNMCGRVPFLPRSEIKIYASCKIAVATNGIRF